MQRLERKDHCTSLCSHTGTSHLLPPLASLLLRILGHPTSNSSVSIEVEPSYKIMSISGLQQQSDSIIYIYIYIYIFFFFKIIFHYRLLQDKVCLNLFLKTLSEAAQN